jgi:AcrR family transcriptional regulator
MDVADWIFSHLSAMEKMLAKYWTVFQYSSSILSHRSIVRWLRNDHYPLRSVIGRESSGGTMPSESNSATATRPGTYVRGTETVDAILKAAHTVLIDEGAAAFTIRRIATECGMNVGNVSYHFPRKEMLIQILLDELLESYDKLLESRVRQPNMTAEERLRLLIVICLEDIAGKRTTRLFTELWALANQNDFIADRVRAFYQRVHDFIGEYVAQLNPALSPEEVQIVALYISASMEGSTPFLGYQKPWAARMPAYINIAATSLITLAKTVTSDQIAGL